jgi:hypothetical protein
MLLKSSAKFNLTNNKICQHHLTVFRRRGYQSYFDSLYDST